MIASRLAVGVIAVSDIRFQVVFLHPGIDMRDIDGHSLAQGGDFLLEGLDGLAQQRTRQRIVQRLLLVAQPAVAGYGLRHIKSIELGRISHRVKAQFQHQQRMLEQKAAQLGHVGFVFTQLDQQRLEIGCFGMWRLAGPRSLGRALRYLAPIQQGEERSIALHNRVVFKLRCQPTLVKPGRSGYHQVGSSSRVGE